MFLPIAWFYAPVFCPLSTVYCLLSTDLPSTQCRYIVQNDRHSTSGVPTFADPLWLRAVGVSPADIAPTVAAFERMLSRFRVASAELLRAYGLTEEAVASRIASRELFAWANVHRNGHSAHEKHLHELSTVSGVYYTSVATGAAPLRFFDPRGAHALVESVGGPLGINTCSPPFVEGFSVEARQGRLVAFPGWLQHSVDPAVAEPAGAEPAAEQRHDAPWRVSFSFNLHGEWRDTASTLLEMTS